MGSEWKILGDFFGLQRGTTYKSKLIGENGPVLLGLGSIAKNGGFRYDKRKRYSGKSPPKLILKPGDIYVSLKDVTQSADLLGAVARVPEEIDSGRLTQDTVKLVFYETAPSTYIYWLLRTPQYRQYCKAHSTGTTNLGLSREDFLSYPVPKLTSTRKVLVEALEAIENKIALNRQQNATLEAMAQALFRSWFVDFDPVLDKALAAGHPIPPPLQAKAQRRLELGDRRKPLPAKVAALFPDRFVYHEEVGWVPEGWAVGKLKDVAFVTMGQSPKGDTYNQDGIGTPLVNGPVEFGEYFVKKEKWTTAPTKLSDKNDLIVCVRGSTIGRYVKSDGEYCLGRGVCSLRGKSVPQAFIDYLYKYSKEDLARQATGSTFPSWSSSTIMNFIVVVPMPEVLNEFGKIVEPALESIQKNINENKSLASLRDTLLPKLISGELRVEPGGNGSFLRVKG